jgi:hypothetical protein
MIESLGAGDGFQGFFASLVDQYAIRLIRVTADLVTCLQRVKSRSRAEHIPVSDDQVMAYNRIAASVVYDWDLEIDNNGPAQDEAIVSAILELDAREP